MNFVIKNNSSRDLSQLAPLVQEFYPYAKKQMGFDKDASIVFESDLENAKNPLGKTAYYNPADYSVTIYVDGRHSKDIMRSISHELVHHHQNCDGKLDNIGPTYEGYAQSDAYLREMEEDAYRRGNLIFRDWENQKNIKEIRKMKVTKKELRGYVYEAMKELLAEQSKTDLPDRARPEGGRRLDEEDEGDLGVQAAKASAAIEKNPKMNAAIDQEVEKILADPKSAAAVLAMANKLGVSQNDDPAEIALKAAQQGNVQEAGKRRRAPSIKLEPDAAATQKVRDRAAAQSGGDAAETAGIALGLGGAIATSLAVGAVGATAGIAGIAAPALLAGGALAGHIMKRVLDARAAAGVPDQTAFKVTRKRGDSLEEGAKPDFLDLDKDGDKEESMKDAADSVKEEQGIFAPNHYCVHHGGVNHNGSVQMAEAVNHNYNEELGRVTHYDMKLEDGTILESVAFEDIQVTNASLAEAHGSHPMKRDDDEEEELKETTDEVVAEDTEEVTTEEVETEELKEWHNKSLYEKLLKEYTKR